MKITRVTYGCQLSTDYIGFTAYDMITKIISLPPAETTKLFDIVVFEINKESRVFSDIQCINPTTLTTFNSAVRSTHTLKNKYIKPTSFDRIIIYDEDVVENTILLEPTSRFSGLQFITCRSLSQIVGWGHPCRFTMGQRWCCPFTDIDNPELSYFKGPPVYEITLIIHGTIDTETVLNIINTSIPKVYGRF